MLVGGHPRLVGALEDGVPAGAGAEVAVHVAGIVLPEVPQDDDVGRRDEGRGQEPQAVGSHVMSNMLVSLEEAVLVGNMPFEYLDLSAGASYFLSTGRLCTLSRFKLHKKK